MKPDPEITLAAAMSSPLSLWSGLSPSPLRVPGRPGPGCRRVLCWLKSDFTFSAGPSHQEKGHSAPDAGWRRDLGAQKHNSVMVSRGERPRCTPGDEDLALRPRSHERRPGPLSSWFSYLGHIHSHCVLSFVVHPSEPTNETPFSLSATDPFSPPEPRSLFLLPHLPLCPRPSDIWLWPPHTPWSCN